MGVSVEEVRSFWNNHPCGVDANAEPESDRRGFFESIARHRYVGDGRRASNCAIVPEVALFHAFAGREVLEIGCGVGTDGLRFAQAGARYTGVDLTPTAISLAREQFALYGASGRFRVADASALPFGDASFHHVYSFGVIHHAPDPEAIVREMARVLQPGGTFCVMVYNRSSIYYQVEIMVLRRLLRLVLGPAFMPEVLSRLTGFSRSRLAHYRSVVGSRRPRSSAEWASMNTDGPDCPLARFHDRAGALALFREFRDVRTETRWAGVDRWPLVGPLVPPRLLEAMGRRWGFFLIVHGRRP